jgi:hypothetical protein
LHGATFLKLKKRFITRHNNPEAVQENRVEPVDPGMRTDS